MELVLILLIALAVVAYILYRIVTRESDQDLIVPDNRSTSIDQSTTEKVRVESDAPIATTDARVEIKPISEKVESVVSTIVTEAVTVTESKPVEASVKPAAPKKARKTKTAKTETTSKQPVRIRKAK